MNTIVCPDCYDGLRFFYTDEYGEESTPCWTCGGTGQAKCDDYGKIIPKIPNQTAISPEKFAKEYAAKHWGDK